MRARHLLVPLLALVPLVACSSDDIVDDLTGPTGLDVRGTYAITGSFFTPMPRSQRMPNRSCAGPWP